MFVRVALGLALLLFASSAMAVNCTFGLPSITEDQNGCCVVTLPLNTSQACGAVTIDYEYSPCDKNGNATSWYPLGSTTYTPPVPSSVKRTLCDFQYCSGFGTKLRFTLYCQSCSCTLVCDIVTAQCYECGCP